MARLPCASLAGDDPFRAADYANVAAALATTGFGAVAPLPDDAAVRAFATGATGVITDTFREDMLAGNVALVVGGTGGIGAGIADAFARVGAVVTVTGATRDEIDAARSAPGFRARDAVVLDVCNDAAVKALIGDLPRLDIVVNCAGIIRRGVEHEPAEFEKTIAVNLTGTMRCCAHAREKLKAARGAIVNIGSVYSFFGAPHAPGYAASKGGVVQLTRSLAVAYAATASGSTPSRRDGSRRR